MTSELQQHVSLVETLISLFFNNALTQLLLEVESSELMLLGTLNFFRGITRGRNDLFPHSIADHVLFIVEKDLDQ